MRRLGLTGFWLAAAALLGSASPPVADVEAPGATVDGALQQPTPAIAPAPEPPPTRTVSQVLGKGVVITVSLASQQMHVFRDGVLWRSSPVSTGKRGKETPTGVFAILQKKTFHRSNLYSNAPMPFMQRLTWGGIAIHAGNLPGYPASHGCIRLPREFASELFKITRSTSTAVIVTDEPLANGAAALALAQRSDAVVPISPDLLKREREALARKAEPAKERLPAARIIGAPPASETTVPPAPLLAGKRQTIQLAAALSSDDAKARWDALVGRRPDLRDMQVAVIPAVVKGTQYYRLRASAPDAHARCTDLQRAGFDCFAVK